MSELSMYGFTDIPVPKPWELDPTERQGFGNNRDITARLKLFDQSQRADKAYEVQRLHCESCRLRGRGALCAAEVDWVHQSTALMLMQACASAVATGLKRPEHGARRNS